MLVLVDATDKLQLVTSAAGDIDVEVAFVDKDAETSTTPGAQHTTIVAAATTDICAAGAGGTVTRNVKAINVANVHAAVSNTVELLLHDGAAARRLFKTTLLPDESLVRDDRGRWTVYDAAGFEKPAGFGTVDPKTNDFRLSGVSATPVMSADSTALGTIFLCQYKGNRIALNDGVRWQMAAPAAEVSLAVTGRTTDLPFDIFAFLNAGVVTLEFLNWASATARATSLTRVDGVWAKTGDATRRYLGSCRPRSATTFHWVRNGDDLPVKLDLWNVDNRIETAFTLRALTNTWTYTIATWRQAQASANYQVEIMVGLQEDWFEATLAVSSRNSSISIAREVGIGFDVTTAFTGITSETTNEVVSITADQMARIKHQPTIGRHFYAWLEISTATGTCTWVGDDGALRIQSGLTGAWEC